MNKAKKMFTNLQTKIAEPKEEESDLLESDGESHAD